MNQEKGSSVSRMERIIDIAQELGLYVILRPSPYICAEWEFGGFPAWLLTKQGIRLRCYNKVYLDCVARYYDKLIPMLTPYQITNGGPILMMQIENEYGSYGNDKDYLNALKKMMEERGITVPFATSDGVEKQYMDDGCVLYRSTITRGKEIRFCKIRGGMDHAIIFADGEQVEIRNDCEMDRTTGFT